jgi:hypothetical protein
MLEQLILAVNHVFRHHKTFFIVLPGSRLPERLYEQRILGVTERRIGYGMRRMSYWIIARRFNA